MNWGDELQCKDYLALGLGSQRIGEASRFRLGICPAPAILVADSILLLQVSGFLAGTGWGPGPPLGSERNPNIENLGRFHARLFKWHRRPGFFATHFFRGRHMGHELLLVRNAHQN